MLLLASATRRGRAGHRLFSPVLPHYPRRLCSHEHLSLVRAPSTAKGADPAQAKELEMVQVMAPALARCMVFRNQLTRNSEKNGSRENDGLNGRRDPRKDCQTSHSTVEAILPSYRPHLQVLAR